MLYEVITNNQIHGLHGQHIGGGICIDGGVGLHGMDKGIHAGCGSNCGGQADGQLRVEQGATWKQA